MDSSRIFKTIPTPSHEEWSPSGIKKKHLQCEHSNSQPALCPLPLIWDPKGLRASLLTGPRCEQVFSPSFTTMADYLTVKASLILARRLEGKAGWLSLGLALLPYVTGDGKGK